MLNKLNPSAIRDNFNIALLNLELHLPEKNTPQAHSELRDT